jgi:hypothetical protein
MLCRKKLLTNGHINEKKMKPEEFLGEGLKIKGWVFVVLVDICDMVSQCVIVLFVGFVKNDEAEVETR